MQNCRRNYNPSRYKKIMMSEKYSHEPVLLKEAIEALAIKPNGIYIDATFGRGGHSQAILKKLNKEGRLYAIDKDPEAVQFARENFAIDERFFSQKISFSQLQHFAEQQGLIGKVGGILMDLGVSSPQLDNPKRGFSFSQESQLDMRMDTESGYTIADWLNRAKESEIADVLHNYGEERYARRIARAIVHERMQKPIITTAHLASVVSAANPSWEKHKHPATRAFQAFRIFINQELDELANALDQVINILACGGRLVVVSFHSLEDRIVKRFMRRHSRPENLPANLPIVATEIRTRLKILGRAIKPTAVEIARNPRSRSAILRVAEKLS